MAFFRQSELRVNGRQRVASSGLPTTDDVFVRMEAAWTPTKEFDVFLSHSYLDQQAILGIVQIFAEAGVSVYVDWIVDHELDRSAVTRDTAELLRQRMTQCKSMIFATSTSSPASKWMPWELGFFDGRFGDRISIMPIDDSVPGAYGQEYLGLYPAIQKVNAPGRTLTAAVDVTGDRYLPLAEFAEGSRRYRKAPYGGL